MKKELGILGVALLVGIALFYLITQSKKIESLKNVPKVLIGKVAEVKMDSLQTMSNDAVSIMFHYTYKPKKADSGKSKNNAIISVRNFARSKGVEEFYDMNFPISEFTNGVLITKVEIKDLKVKLRLDDKRERNKKRVADLKKAIEKITKTIKDSPNLVTTKVIDESLWLYFKNDWLEIESTYVGSYLISGYYITNISSGGNDLDRLSEQQRSKVYNALYSKVKKQRQVDSDKAVKNINENFGK